MVSVFRYCRKLEEKFTIEIVFFFFFSVIFVPAEVEFFSVFCPQKQK